MLIKGSQLTQSQYNQVLAAYVHRHTVEHPANWATGPTSQTDREWVNAHAFHFVKDGSRLSAKHRHCEPHYMADGEIIVDGSKWTYVVGGKVKYSGFGQWVGA